MRACILGLAAVVPLAGCGPGGPGVLEAPGSARAAVRVVVQPRAGAERGLLALITENRRRIHHVNLRLHRRAPDGTWPANPVASRVDLPPAALGDPIVIERLRFGTAYRLAVEAYAAQAESLATLLSDGAASRVEFTLPGLGLLGGVPVAPSAQALVVPLVLLDTPYAGQATFSLAVVNPQVNQILLELRAAGVVVASKSYTRGSAPATGSLANLRLGTPYTLVASGFRGSSSAISTASVTFTTPTVSASGTVETGPFGPYALSLL